MPQRFPNLANIMYNSGMAKSPNPASIVSKRRVRSQRRQRQPQARFTRIGIGVLGIFSVLLVAGILTGALAYVRITAELPSIDGLPELLGERGVLRQPTELYDRTGEHLLVSLHNPNTSKARYLFLELIPQEVKDATLTVRDPNFWTHSGYQINAEKPSLAEQLVLEMLLWQEPESIQRTWRIRLLAAQITERYGRETVLEWYLNNAAFGQMAFGIDEAAWVFFGKEAQQLNLAEAALLAAAVDAPALNPIDTPQIAIERQGTILQQMVRAGLLSGEKALGANQEPILLQTSALPLPMEAPDFTSLALKTLYADIGQERIQRGGFEVITSLDLDLQSQTMCTIEVQLARLNGSLPSDTLGNRTCKSAALLPGLNRDQIISDLPAKAGVVILDSESGEVLALSGDTNTPYQAGTILSPLVYLTAFTRGLSPASMVWDIPASLPPTLDGYGNLDNTFHGPMQIRTASAFDYLVPLLATLNQIGPTNAWRTAQQSGINSLDVAQFADSYSPVLDQGHLNLMELTHAYSMFANQGKLTGAAVSGQGSIMPILILQVLDGTGRIWPVQQAETRIITTPQLAYLVTDMLSDEEARRESLGHPNPFDIARPVAGKLGRGVTESSTWTIGYTPDRVIGVWMGLAPGEGLADETRLSPIVSSGIWHALMKTAHQSLEFRTWNEPLGMVHQVVCVPSGMLPTEECPKTSNEVFITGNEPRQADSLYQTFMINTQTGRLATIYTPTEFLEEKVYLVVPPEAQEWATAEGLPIPPDTYDVVFNQGSPGQTASILSPEIFSYVSGQVEISGHAGGENFDFYRLQIGEGLNPRQWLQIGEDSSIPVENDTLATWDTSGLNGLFAVRLQVVAKDQSVETISIQVTVDNQAPAVQVIYPSEGQIFTYPEEKEIAFQVQATDNLGLTRLEFWLDGRMISSLSNPPYAAPWSGTPGEHELEIRALDQAGNTTVVLVPFSLEE